MMSIERRVCPLLEHEGATRVLRYAPAPWVLRQCLETGFVFLENPPAYEALKEDYAWEVTAQREAERRRNAEPLLYAVSTGIKRFRARFLKRDKVRGLCVEVLRRIDSPSVNLLDVGCGWGGLLSNVMAAIPEAVRSRCVPHGIEISKNLAQVSNETLGRLGGECIHASAIDGMGRYPEGHFDLIVLSSILEHEADPLTLLRCCRRHLRPDGHIIVKVPNFGSFNRYVRGARWCGFRWPDHVNYFTPATLAAMVAKAQLRISRMRLSDRQPFNDNMYAMLRHSGSPASGRAVS